MKKNKALDFVAVGLDFLESNPEISNKDLGAALRLVSWQYRHPEAGNVLEGAKSWTPTKWAVNCLGLKSSNVEKDVKGLWHWEGDSLVIDCFQDGIKAALEKRKSLKINADMRWRGKEKNGGEGMQLHCKSIASNKYKVEEESTRESTRERESTSYRQKKEDENILSGRDEQKEREAIRQSVEETKHKQSVEGSDKQATIDKDERSRALDISKTEAFKQWAENTCRILTLDSLRTSEDGISRIVDLVREFESIKDNPTASSEDDIPF